MCGLLLETGRDRGKGSSREEPGGLWRRRLLQMEVYKPARDVNKPKRPGTAFMLFMADFRKEMAGKEPEGGVAALAKLGEFRLGVNGTAHFLLTLRPRVPSICRNTLRDLQSKEGGVREKRKMLGSATCEKLAIAGRADEPKTAVLPSRRHNLP